MRCSLHTLEMGHTLQTARLELRPLAESEAEFILSLLNEPSFLENIGDRGVRTLDDAREWIQRAPMASYERFGFGLLLVSLRESGTPIGICGLLKRETLDDPDIGYALLPAYWGQGYALEAAMAITTDAWERFGLQRIAAIAKPENRASIRVLEKLGFRFERIGVVTQDGQESAIFLRERTQ